MTKTNLRWLAAKVICWIVFVLWILAAITTSNSRGLQPHDRLGLLLLGSAVLVMLALPVLVLILLVIEFFAKENDTPGFFNPWRRKAGLVTLLMALLFALAWGRSTFDDDFFWGGMVSHNGAIERRATEDSDGQLEVRVTPSGETTEMIYYRIPYWSIVIPLTMLSAWLLLSKPRVAKPPVTTEPK